MLKDQPGCWRILGWNADCQINLTVLHICNIGGVDHKANDFGKLFSLDIIRLKAKRAVHKHCTLLVNLFLIGVSIGNSKTNLPVY